MPTYKTTGIILGRSNLGEADRILTILTKDKGMVRAVGKGLRRAKSKLAGHVELFSETELMLVNGRSLDVLTSARLVKVPANLTADYDQLRQAYLFCEIIAKVGDENQHHEGLYELLAEALAALADGRGGPELELWFKLGLLDKLGYRPALDGCMICRANDEGRQYRFNLELGGIVDEGCASAGNLPMDQTQIKLWRIMMSRPFKTVADIAQADKLASEGLVICNAFYDYTFGKRFKSEQVLA